MEPDTWDARYAAAELVWSAEPNRFLVAEVGDLSPGRALDVACGEGRNAIWLAERGWQVTGVDFSSVGLSKARRLAASRGAAVRWLLADVVSQPVDELAGEGAFDLVVVLYLQLAPAARRTAMASAGRAVVPGGTLVVVAHDTTNLAEGYGGPQDPDVLYAPDDVVTDLSDVAGLVITKAQRVPRPVETEDGTRTAIDALVRASKPA
jgi:SAM-dependent methyltransferase